jgi:hypothetical protein
MTADGHPSLYHNTFTNVHVFTNHDLASDLRAIAAQGREACMWA